MMGQTEMFDRTSVWMTPEDADIAMEVLDYSGFWIEDDVDCGIMIDCRRLSERGFNSVEINTIMEKTDNRPFYCD
jgi:hypothetical protein